MIISNNNYKLIALDTNIIREVCMYNESYKNKLFEKFILGSEAYAFCFSIYNVFELKPYDDIYEEFVDFFSLIPALMLFPYSLILSKEAECYRKGLDFVIDNSVANAFSSAGKDKSYDFKEFLDGIFENKSFVNVVKAELAELPSVADEWNKQREDAIRLLKANGYPLNMINDRYYRSNEQVTIVKDLGLHDIHLNSDSDFKRFPAARIMEYSQFNRVHMTKKNIVANDVVDVQLSAMAPYVDAVITEKFQSNVYRKARNFITELNDLEVYTLKDLR